MRSAWVAVPLVILAGCTAGQQYLQSMVPELQQATSIVHACERTLEQDHRYDRIYEKLAVPKSTNDLGKSTAAQLGDGEIVSDADKALFIEWYAKSEECMTPVVERFAQLTPNGEHTKPKPKGRRWT